MYTPQQIEPRLGPKILLVEDQRLYRHIASQCLVKYERVMAKNATEALQKFIIEEPDITFLDIMLPDGNGLELLEEFRRLRPHAYVVMVTSSTEQTDFTKAASLGAAGFIRKPFNNTAVLKQLDHYQTYGTPAIRRHNKPLPPIVTAVKKKPVNASALDKRSQLARAMNVLCIEYNAMRADALQAHLKEQYGCQVEVVETYPDAAMQLSNNRYDVIIMVMQIKGHSGYQFVNRLRRQKGRNYEATVVAMLSDTQNSKDDDTQKWRMAGADYALQLPFRLANLDDIIAKHLDHWFTHQAMKTVDD